MIPVSGGIVAASKIVGSARMLPSMRAMPACLTALASGRMRVNGRLCARA